jgi:predicted Fe-Mo cluster-binding NifX family protein
MRIAIASSNGESVDQHFGQAGSFLIYEVGNGSIDFIEDRKLNHNPDGKAHSEDNLAKTVNLLKDCSAVFVLKIGLRSARYLYEHNIKSFEVAFPLNHIFKTLLKNQAKGRVRMLG